MWRQVAEAGRSIVTGQGNDVSSRNRPSAHGAGLLVGCVRLLHGPRSSLNPLRPAFYCFGNAGHCRRPAVGAYLHCRFRPQHHDSSRHKLLLRLLPSLPAQGWRTQPRPILTTRMPELLWLNSRLLQEGGLAAQPVLLSMLYLTCGCLRVRACVWRGGEGEGLFRCFLSHSVSQFSGCGRATMAAWFLKDFRDSIFWKVTGNVGKRCAIRGCLTGERL